jgi:dolichol-phosphate mannosyltransferase
MTPQLTLVVPTYNERESLEALVDQVLAACRSSGLRAEIIVVDDNSPDGTGEEATRLAPMRPMRVIHRSGKWGLGSAVMEGIAAARGDVVGVMDADLSHPPDMVPVLYDALILSQVDLVLASRYVAGGGSRDWPFSRLVISKLACWAARPLTPARDPMSGFLMMRRGFVAEFRTSARGFKIGLELLVRSHPRAIGEVPYVFVGRASGESKMGLRETLRYLRQLGELFVLLLRGGFAWPSHRVIEPSAVVRDADGARRRLSSYELGATGIGS